LQINAFKICRFAVDKRINLADARPSRVAGMGVHHEGTSPMPFERGGNGCTGALT